MSEEVLLKLKRKNTQKLFSVKDFFIMFLCIGILAAIVIYSEYKFNIDRSYYTVTILAILVYVLSNSGNNYKYYKKEQNIKFLPIKFLFPIFRNI